MAHFYTVRYLWADLALFRLKFYTGDMISLAALSMLLSGTMSFGSPTALNPEFQQGGIQGRVGVQWGLGKDFGSGIHWDGSTNQDGEDLMNHKCFHGGLGGVWFNPYKDLGDQHIFFEPGMLLYNGDSSSQILILLWGYDDRYTSEDYHYKGFGLTLAMHGPSAAGEHKRAMHVACIEMDKKMPSDMDFRARPCKDAILTKLCSIDKDEPIRGLYDQPRIWIYTDHATMAQCNEHLQREITPSIYLRSLWEASTVGGVDLSKPVVRRCVEPRLIEGINAPKDAKIWLVQTLDKIDGKALLKIVQTDGKAFPRLIDDEHDQADMADLLDALADSTTPGVAAAVPGFIKVAIPESKRDAVLSHCTHDFTKA